MIVVNLKGGMGNQMFQYACGRAMSLRNNDVLKLDATSYKLKLAAYTPREYALSPFNIQEVFANNEEIRKLKYPYGLISKGLRFFRARVLRRFNTLFDEKMYNLKGDRYLDGFWQTEKYFMAQEKQIRSDFKLKSALRPEANSIQQKINNSDISVSLHIRRGDYAYDPKTFNYNGLCSLEYYESAIKYIENAISNTKFTIFVFSDDIEWAKNNLKYDHETVYVSDPDKIKDYEELILMSKCTHNIIANSTFSWWGAWLNENPNKIVIAPKKWVMGDDRDFNDIIPSSWIRL